MKMSKEETEIQLKKMREIQVELEQVFERLKKILGAHWI